MTGSSEPTGGWTSGVESWGAPVGPVTSLDRDELTPERFRSEFVDRCRPLHIRGGAAHWPALRRWADAGYLREKLGSEEFPVHSKPVLELKWRASFWPDRFRESFAAEEFRSMGFDELWDLAVSQRFAFAYSALATQESRLGALTEDVDVDLVPEPRRPLYYSPLRLFLHGRSYTDWHYHPQDETLMCQFGRPKEVALLPPVPTWDVFLEVARDEDYIGPADPARYPALATLEPRTVVTEPGDACYIPPHWWHAVECVDSTPALGGTAAYCWRSPRHIHLDPRFPYRRFLRRTGRLRTRARYALDAVLWWAFARRGRALPSIPMESSPPP